MCKISGLKVIKKSLLKMGIKIYIKRKTKNFFSKIRLFKENILLWSLEKYCTIMLSDF